MSVGITHSFTTTVLADQSKPLVELEDDRLFIWPAGVGTGPLISMTVADWARISKEVGLAISPGRKRI